jgi:hypothetical protein
MKKRHIALAPKLSSGETVPTRMFLYRKNWKLGLSHKLSCWPKGGPSFYYSCGFDPCNNDLKELTPSRLAVERAEFAAKIRKPQVIECTHGLLADESTNGSLKQTNHTPRATIRARPVPAPPTSSIFCRNSRERTL